MLQSVGKPNEVSQSTEIRSVMAKMFPDQNEVLADWFTGNIIIPDGELVSYVHMAYASTYSKYIILQVKNGAITRNWTAESAEFIKFRDAQFAAFKKTDNSLQFALHGSLAVLHLPAVKIRAVVLKEQPIVHQTRSSSVLYGCQVSSPPRRACTDRKRQIRLPAHPE